MLELLAIACALCCAPDDVVAPAVVPGSARVVEIDAAGGGLGPDPYLRHQWAWWAIGADRIRPLEVWQRPQRIAVLDTGIGPWHEEVAGDVELWSVAGFNPIDDYGHGTHCATNAAALTGNGVGIASIFGPGATPVSVKVLQFGGGTPLTVALGMALAASQDVGVLSLSLQGAAYDPVYEVGFDLVDAMGGVAVVAAGNRPTRGVQWPGKHPRAICVSALDERLELASYSSWGPEVDFCAPGSNVLAGYPFGGKFTTGRSSLYVAMSGTSMATPIVAALCARMRSDQPWMDRDACYNALRYTAVDLGAPGFDPLYGWGMVTADCVDLCRWDRADTTRDGVADLGDALEFLRWFAAGDPRADWDLDGDLDAADEALYIRDLRILGG